MLDGEYIKDGRIDTTEEGIEFWATKINCSSQDLINAVNCIGDNYKILKLYLELNRLIKDE